MTSRAPDARMYIQPYFSQFAALRLRGLRGCSITTDIISSLAQVEDVDEVARCEARKRDERNRDDNPEHDVLVLDALAPEINQDHTQAV